MSFTSTPRSEGLFGKDRSLQSNNICYNRHIQTYHTTKTEKTLEYLSYAFQKPVEVDFLQAPDTFWVLAEFGFQHISPISHARHANDPCPSTCHERSRFAGFSLVMIQEALSPQISVAPI